MGLGTARGSRLFCKQDIQLGSIPSSSTVNLFIVYCLDKFVYADLAQLGWALALQARCREFESLNRYLCQTTVWPVIENEFSKRILMFIETCEAYEMEVRNLAPWSSG